MWNLNPDYIQQVKEELKGRRAAIEAMLADELKGIAAELEEIEQLESVAYAFAVKHLPQLTLGAPADEPVVEVAPLEAEPVPEEPPVVEATAEPNREAKSATSRWRVRASS